MKKASRKRMVRVAVDREPLVELMKELPDDCVIMVFKSRGKKDKRKRVYCLIVKPILKVDGDGGLITMIADVNKGWQRNTFMFRVGTKGVWKYNKELTKAKAKAIIKKFNDARQLALAVELTKGKPILKH